MTRSINQKNDYFNFRVLHGKEVNYTYIFRQYFSVSYDTTATGHAIQNARSKEYMCLGPTIA